MSTQRPTRVDRGGRAIALVFVAAGLSPLTDPAAGLAALVALDAMIALGAAASVLAEALR